MRGSWPSACSRRLSCSRQRSERPSAPAWGELVHSEVKSKIEQEAFETIPYGEVGLIVAYLRSSAGGVDKAVTHALKKALAEVQEKMK